VEKGEEADGKIRCRRRKFIGEREWRNEEEERKKKEEEHEGPLQNSR